MTWRKLGHVYVAEGVHGWDRSHATCPTPHVMPDGTFRIIFAAADTDNVSRVGYLDLDPADPTTVVAVGETPALDIGEDGTFDDNGINPTSLIEFDGGLRLYYAGFQLQRKIAYTLFSGLAESRDGGLTFERVKRVPVLDRSDSELYFRTGPCVLRHDDAWHAWYVAGDSWIETSNGRKPLYGIRHVVSEDGIHWPTSGAPCLAPNTDNAEIGFGRPFVLHENGIFRMWYSIRSQWGYVLGYAESGDGMTWERRDAEVGIAPSENGWDSEMLCFASIADSTEGRFMFYNGNGFGRTGFGVAVLDG